MKKAGIDIKGPKSFLQVKEEYENEESAEEGSQAEGTAETNNGAEAETDSEAETGNVAETETGAETTAEASSESSSESESDASESSQTEAENQIDAELKKESMEENESMGVSTATKITKVSEPKETDDLTDDDGVEPEPKVNNLKKKSKAPVIFTEMSSETKTATTNKLKTALRNNKNPNKKKEDILYNPPAKKIPSQKMDKIKILRENSMRTLQKKHVWFAARKERDNEGFNKNKYQQGNKNADLFVSFLGYIRDTTYKQSPPLFDKIKRKFTKGLRR